MQVFKPGTRVKCVFSNFWATGKTATVLLNNPMRDSKIQIRWDDNDDRDTGWSYQSSFEVVDLPPTIDPYNGGIQLYN